MLNPNLQKCYEAFERLKQGQGTHERCIGLPLSEITFAKISLEAGHDAGYLKKKRPQHIPLLSLLNSFLDTLEPETNKVNAGIKQAQQKEKKLKAEIEDLTLKLEASLFRELRLFEKLKEIEGVVNCESK